MKTNTGLVNYAKAMVGKPYWYGCFGNIATASLYEYKRKQYPAMYRSWNDFPKQYGERVHDCVGLIKGYLWSASTTSEPKYTSRQDVSAFGMYNVSKKRGKMDTFPGISGTLVYKSNNGNYLSIHHVGVYHDGYVYEAKGHQYGVVKTKFRKNEWSHWSLCPFIVYQNDEPEEPKQPAKPAKKSIETIANEVLKGLWGIGNTRKSKLTKAGYNYKQVQEKVNELLKKPVKRKSNEQIAREVLKGYWGTGDTRRKKLQSAGYDYDEIQRIVNRLLR